MKLLTLFCLLTLANISFGRSPAVLDFVGIEPMNAPKQIVAVNNPVGFKFMDKQARSPQSIGHEVESQLPEGVMTFSTLFSLLVILSLPFVSWFVIQNQMDKKRRENLQKSEEIISKYKKAKKESSSDDDDDFFSKAG